MRKHASILSAPSARASASSTWSWSCNSRGEARSPASTAAAAAEYAVLDDLQYSQAPNQLAQTNPQTGHVHGNWKPRERNRAKCRDSESASAGVEPSRCHSSKQDRPSASPFSSSSPKSAVFMELTASTIWLVSAMQGGAQLCAAPFCGMNATGVAQKSSWPMPSRNSSGSKPSPLSTSEGAPPGSSLPAAWRAIAATAEHNGSHHRDDTS
mmetsp:Transcript_7426/g.20099  ORF Transcript_7426/g.20099 Transcript_7426/m.20099 type:complete len:211 (+) Transcript_7426:1170-1802(+)